MLDVAAIVVLGSGLYIWLRKPKASIAPDAPAQGEPAPAGVMARSHLEGNAR